MFKRFIIRLKYILESFCFSNDRSLIFEYKNSKSELNENIKLKIDFSSTPINLKNSCKWRREPCGSGVSCPCLKNKTNCVYIYRGRLVEFKRSDLLLKIKKWIKSGKLVWTYKLPEVFGYRDL